MNEIWKPVISYEGWYSISNFGNIRREKENWHGRKGYLIKPCADKAGYSIVVLCKNGKTKTFKQHVLVARNFIGERPEGLVINHKDGNKTNNHVDNLEYVTQSENEFHAYRNGFKFGQSGMNNPMTKISDDDVLAIRLQHRNGNISRSEIGRVYGISEAQVGKIIRFERRKLATPIPK